MKKQAFLKKILVVLLIVMSFNINTFAQELSNGRDIKEVIGKDENGTSVIGGLIPGSYTLTEVSAPKGYKLSSKSYEIVIPESYEGEYVSQEVEVINVLQDPALPNTGFSSFLMNSAFGAVLLGLVLILVSKKKYE